MEALSSQQRERCGLLPAATRETKYVLAYQFPKSSFRVDLLAGGGLVQVEIGAGE
jgi:hypothetical protein